jgi:hypothetical protein
MAVTGGSPSFTNVTATGNLTVNGNTTLGDASTDTILMTGAPSIGGAGLGMGMGFRNRIINGAMVIDQRNAGASVTPTTSSDGYPVDRFAVAVSQNSKLTCQQNAGGLTGINLPVGFQNYLGVTSSSAYSVISSDVFAIYHRIEGFNFADMQWGTANAKTITLSFQVYSSLTGTFGGALRNAASNRSYPFTYTISAANTWTSISITIAGDTSGTWVGATNGIGLQLWIGLGVGSTASGTAGSWAGANYSSATGATSVVGTNGATFYITGVQLEKGSTATSFDYRPYGTELALCQRYYIQLGGNTNQRYGVGWYTNATTGYPFCPTPVTMRDPANASMQYSSLSHFNIYSGGSALTPTVIVFDSGSNNGFSLAVTTSGATTGWAATLLAASTSARLGFSNEL